MKCCGGAALASIKAHDDTLAAMQPPASIVAAEADKSGAAWDWVVDCAVAERKQAVYDLAYKVRSKYFKNLEGDLKSTAKESYNKIRPYTGGAPGDPKDVVIEQTFEWTKVWCPLRAEAVPLEKPVPNESTLPIVTTAQLRRKLLHTLPASS